MSKELKGKNELTRFIDKSGSGKEYLEVTNLIH